MLDPDIVDLGFAGDGLGGCADRQVVARIALGEFDKAIQLTLPVARIAV